MPFSSPQSVVATFPGAQDDIMSLSEKQARCADQQHAVLPSRRKLSVPERLEAARTTERPFSRRHSRVVTLYDGPLDVRKNLSSKIAWYVLIVLEFFSFNVAFAIL